MRVQATTDNTTTGSTVYKGKGKVAQKVTAMRFGRLPWGDENETLIQTVKADALGATFSRDRKYPGLNRAWMSLKDFTVEI